MTGSRLHIRIAAAEREAGADLDQVLHDLRHRELRDALIRRLTADGYSGRQLVHKLGIGWKELRRALNNEEVDA